MQEVFVFIIHALPFIICVIVIVESEVSELAQFFFHFFVIGHRFNGNKPFYKLIFLNIDFLMKNNLYLVKFLVNMSKWLFHSRTNCNPIGSACMQQLLNSKSWNFRAVVTIGVYMQAFLLKSDIGEDLAEIMDINFPSKLTKPINKQILFVVDNYAKFEFADFLYR